ncbi:MAG TPA: hypothetical protein PLD54_02770 [Candidatus Levybacteria bacterium]|nr:hypothetical protein [Candidatus Levybacteria bacterium]
MIITKSTPYTKEEIEMNNKTILESLSMDLLRVALGLHRGSIKMAERFTQEALARKAETDKENLSLYGRQILAKIERSLNNDDLDKKAEDALMYSTIIKNYSTLL